MLVFGQIQVRLESVLRVSTILGYHYQALTRLRLQSFVIRLNNEPRVETPLRPNLRVSIYLKLCKNLLLNLHVKVFNLKNLHSTLFYLGDANGRCPAPRTGVDKSEVTAPDPALGVIIIFRKSAFVIRWDGGSTNVSGAAGVANS